MLWVIILKLISQPIWLLWNDNTSNSTSQSRTLELRRFTIQHKQKHIHATRQMYQGNLKFQSHFCVPNRIMNIFIPNIFSALFFNYKNCFAIIFCPPTPSRLSFAWNLCLASQCVLIFCVFDSQRVFFSRAIHRKAVQSGKSTQPFYP